MKHIDFLWDEQKDTLNRKKHGVSFEEASTVFYDRNARLIYDPDHSKNEDRFILLGISAKPRLLLVCHCYKKNAKIVRIISARKANKHEIKQYGEFL
ncbi:MAG: hypothetical protein A2Y12_11730 [Planctomycetes bacterium GWF2_42_9]|nr:MAG: hypothetical protein A2Y12_11730 [Planctomycetes bacterium GWF2_42_9]